MKCCCLTSLLLVLGYLACAQDGLKEAIISDLHELDDSFHSGVYHTGDKNEYERFTGLVDRLDSTVVLYLQRSGSRPEDLLVSESTFVQYTPDSVLFSFCFWEPTYGSMSVISRAYVGRTDADNRGLLRLDFCPQLIHPVFDSYYVIGGGEGLNSSGYDDVLVPVKAEEDCVVLAGSLIPQGVNRTYHLEHLGILELMDQKIVCRRCVIEMESQFDPGSGVLDLGAATIYYSVRNGEQCQYTVSNLKLLFRFPEFKLEETGKSECY